VGGTCGTHGGGKRYLQGLGWEDLGVRGRITLRWSLGRYRLMGRTGFSWLRIGSSGGLV
jgi:hypothetical protein